MTFLTFLLPCNNHIYTYFDNSYLNLNIIAKDVFTFSISLVIIIDDEEDRDDAEAVDDEVAGDDVAALIPGIAFVVELDAEVP